MFLCPLSQARHWHFLGRFWLFKIIKIFLFTCNRLLKGFDSSKYNIPCTNINLKEHHIRDGQWNFNWDVYSKDLGYYMYADLDQSGSGAHSNRTWSTSFNYVMLQYLYNRLSIFILIYIYDNSIIWWRRFKNENCQSYRNAPLYISHDIMEMLSMYHNSREGGGPESVFFYNEQRSYGASYCYVPG